MKLIHSILLFVLALIMFSLLAPLGFIWALVTSIRKLVFNQFVIYLSNIFFSLAFALDLIGNVILAPFLNRWFITKLSYYHFGSIKHTISLVIGYNFRENTLTSLGLVFYYILEFCDKNHCEIAIKDFENIQFKNNKYNI